MFKVQKPVVIGQTDELSSRSVLEVSSRIFSGTMGILDKFNEM